MESLDHLVAAGINRHREALDATYALIPEITRLAAEVRATLARGNKILLCGNGGSAADAQHLAAEFVGRFVLERDALPAIALTTDTSILTAVANDYGYNAVFARQVQALGVPGDLLIAISTSGNSPSIISAAEVARGRGLTVAGFTGATGGNLKALCDHWIGIPHPETARIQEMHILIGHLLCEAADVQ